MRTISACRVGGFTAQPVLVEMSARATATVPSGLAVMARMSYPVIRVRRWLPSGRAL